MGTQVGAISKGAVTVLARKWALTCVCANVSSEQPWSGESFAAGGTNTWQSVRANMHLQCSQTGVLLRAVFAVEGRACGDLTRQGRRLLQGSAEGVRVLGHLMVGQCREAGVAVAAVHAVVKVLDDIRAGWI